MASSGGEMAGGGGAQASLTWDAVTTNADGTPITDLAGYRVYHGTSSGSYGMPLDAGPQTMYVVTGLESGKRHYFAVTAYDTSGNESVVSDEVSKDL
jgi:fibronectin type 3 domain-containing protein